MKHTLLLCALSAALLSACNRAPAPAETANAPSATQPASDTDMAPTVQKSHPATAQEIAEIKATGKTGLWADVDAVCAKGRAPRTMLSWNVSDSGADKVVVYVVDKNGDERHFGQGGPVGHKQTGPWLKPGLGFKIRQAGTKTELGTLTIADKHC